MQKRNFLFKARRSRKSYFLVYLMIFIVMGILIYFYARGLTIPTSTLIISLVFILVLIKFTEIHRLKDWWGISDSGLTQSLGLLNKNVREVGFSSISDMDVHKPFLKRFLNYGDVNIRLFLNETSIKIKDISNPEQFVESFQIIISQNKGGNNGITQK
jgi:hypothetical protein